MSFGDDLHESPAAPADPLDGFHAFAGAVRARLDKGRIEYGDASFSAAPAALLGELQQEALDLAGWGFVLWTRLETMRAAVAQLEARHGTEPTP